MHQTSFGYNIWRYFDHFKWIQTFDQTKRETHTKLMNALTTIAYTHRAEHITQYSEKDTKDTYRIREGEFLIKWWQINNKKNSHEYWIKQKSGRTIVCLILFLMKSNYSMCRLTVVGALFLCAQATNGRIFCDSDLIAEIRRHLKCDTKQI